MKPTVGRIVHYYSPIAGGPHAAIVVAVHPSGRVDLTVFESKLPPASVERVPQNHAGEDGWGWCWPPRT